MYHPEKEELGVKPRENEVLLVIISILQVDKLSVKGIFKKYFGLCGPYGLCQYCGTVAGKAATDNM